MNSQMIFTGALWGILLGLFYFGGLWFTVQWVPRVNNPRLLLLASFIGRSAGAVALFRLILLKDPAVFVITLLFFFLVRIAMTRLLGRPAKGGLHAN